MRPFGPVGILGELTGIRDISSWRLRLSSRRRLSHMMCTGILIALPFQPYIVQ